MRCRKLIFETWLFKFPWLLRQRIFPSVPRHAAPTELGWGFGLAAGYKHGAPNGALRDANPAKRSDAQGAYSLS
jgi:hypothetical protein